MSSPGATDAAAQRALDACATRLRAMSRESDALASRIGATLGGTATGVDRQLAASLRRLAVDAYGAASAIEMARPR
ncbi:MAG: hypothetical protein QOD69_1795 [Solirubrobacteraceae bacterium]|jgi:hypothetical protein|nr:hypothetical protein [Solirubrobacteraceae bacterium]